MKYSEAFNLRLNKRYADEYLNGTLIVPGREFWFENKNGVFEIVIESVDDDMVYIRPIHEKDKEPWTLDNLYLFDMEYVQQLYKKASELGNISEINFKDVNLDIEGIYILHDTECDEKHGFYVGQAKHIGWRMLDHNQESGQQVIDKAIASGKVFTLQTITLEQSDYTNLNALEAAFIAYFQSYHKFGAGGFNQDRGTNGPGSTSKGKRMI